jgi:hypothetical protein
LIPTEGKNSTKEEGGEDREAKTVTILGVVRSSHNIKLERKRLKDSPNRNALTYINLKIL